MSLFLWHCLQAGISKAVHDISAYIAAECNWHKFLVHAIVMWTSNQVCTKYNIHLNWYVFHILLIFSIQPLSCQIIQAIASKFRFQMKSLEQWTKKSNSSKLHYVRKHQRRHINRRRGVPTRLLWHIGDAGWNEASPMSSLPARRDNPCLLCTLIGDAGRKAASSRV